MTLNGEMAFILRYFTELGNGPYLAFFHRILYYVVVVKQMLGLTRFQNLLLTVYVYDHTNTICAIIQ